MKIRPIDHGKTLMFECPGCGENHGVTVAGDSIPHPCWTWNGDLDRPTLSPSILCRGYKFASKDDNTQVAYVCHSFVRDGMIQFLADCTHELAGQTVPLPEVEV